ncbi:unnamed protein product [Owenia fusiformis]|uniref:Polycystic kidney disease protein 1-like 2 n=2 Tax=Owenia fusiformis TaxID=6347 RepID=A0A8J1U4K3_OWEFU|nr:unnamed protein product [Owenia fusiformis]
MSFMTETFTSLVDTQQSTATTEQQYGAAQDIIACLGNALESATEAVTADLMEGRRINEASEPLQQHNGSTVEQPQVEQPQVDQETVKDAARQKAKKFTEKTMLATNKIMDMWLGSMGVGEEPAVFNTNMFSITASRESVSDLSNKKVTVNSGGFTMPNANAIVGNESSSSLSYIDTKVFAAKINPYIWDDSSSSVKSPILSLVLVDDNGDELVVKNTTEPFVIDIVLPQHDNVIEHVIPVLGDDDTMYFHSTNITSNHSSLQVVIKPDDDDAEFEVLVKYNDYPTGTDFDFQFFIPHRIDDTASVNELVMNELNYTIFVPAHALTAVGTGVYYIGVRPKGNGTNESNEEGYIEYDYDAPVLGEVEENVRDPFPNYTIQFVGGGCHFWDVLDEQWKSDGCQVSPLSNTRFTRCLCNHLTSFGADFFVPPNSIDFNAVFSNFGERILDNNAVLITILTIFVFYFGVIIWARRKDRQDISKWGVSPLADNIVSDTYLYQMTVYTGMRSGAGTKSNISFVLSGDKTDSGIRELSDEKKEKKFLRGSINNFLMSVPGPLGPLSYLRIWHDNSGKGKFTGWYLNRIIVKDLQTGECFFFLCKRWLAVEEDDGLIDRLVPVAGHNDVTNFFNLFGSTTRKSISDSHLWVSVLSRPNKSNFTRVQRSSCILSLIFTTMVANAMFYQTGGTTKETGVGLQIGPIRITLKQIWISFVSSMVVLPVNIAIDQLFRRSKRRTTKVESKLDGAGFLSKLSQTAWGKQKVQKRKPDIAIIDDKDNISESGRHSSDSGVDIPTMMEDDGYYTRDELDNRPFSCVSLPGSVVESEDRNESPLSGKLDENVIQSRFGLQYDNDTTKKLRFQLPDTKTLISPSSLTLHVSTDNIPRQPVDLPQLFPRPGSKLSTGITSITSFANLTNNKTIVSDISDSGNKLNDQPVKKKRKKMLPHWCAYIAWLLVFLSTGSSAFFTILYSLEWGKEKSEMWLSAMLLSITESAAVIQPTKIIILAIIVALIFKKPDLDDGDDEEEDEIRNILKNDEELVAKRPKRVSRKDLKIAQPDPIQLAASRELRLNEIKMHAILREITLYFIFTGLLVYVAHSNRDYQSYNTNEDIKKTFFYSKPYFEKINRPEMFWDWVKEVLLPGLYPDGDPLTGADKRITANYVAYRVGPPRIRQLRVKPDRCHSNMFLKNFATECNVDYTWFDEENGDFAENWNASATLISNDRWSPWIYRSSMELEGIPFPGIWTVYGGGGYVLDIVGSLGRVLSTVNDASKTQWIDEYTRMLSVEFTIYNANVNLFSVITMLSEWPTSRSNIASINIQTFRLFSYIGATAIVVLVSEILCVICLFVFLVRLVKDIRQQKKAYFRSFWNTMEVFTLITGFLAMVMYFLRHAMTVYMMSSVKALQGKFKNFARVAWWDELFGYLMGVLVYLSFIKMIHILRFNKRMSMLASTLKASAGDMGGFAFMFLIVFMAYAQMAYLVFGADIVDYSSFIGTLEAMFSILLGHFNLEALTRVHIIIGPFFFFSFVALMVFVMTNIFLTIILDGFKMVKEDLSKQSNEHEIIDFIWKRFTSWSGLDFAKMFGKKVAVYTLDEKIRKHSKRFAYKSLKSFDVCPLCQMHATDDSKLAVDNISNIYDQRDLKTPVDNLDHRLIHLSSRVSDLFDEMVKDDVIVFEHVILEEKLQQMKVQKSKMSSTSIGSWESVDLGEIPTDISV